MRWGLMPIRRANSHALFPHISMLKLSSIAKTLKKLTQAPVPVLPPSVRALRVTMAMRNAHFGARYVLLESETALSTFVRH